jgi:hypothetical protein
MWYELRWTWIFPALFISYEWKSSRKQTFKK